MSYNDLDRIGQTLSNLGGSVNTLGQSFVNLDIANINMRKREGEKSYQNSKNKLDTYFSGVMSKENISNVLNSTEDLSLYYDDPKALSNLIMNNAYGSIKDTNFLSKWGITEDEYERWQSEDGARYSINLDNTISQYLSMHEIAKNIDEEKLSIQGDATNPKVTFSKTLKNFDDWVKLNPELDTKEYRKQFDATLFAASITDASNYFSLLYDKRMKGRDEDYITVDEMVDKAKSKFDSNFNELISYMKKNGADPSIIKAYLDNKESTKNQLENTLYNIYTENENKRNKNASDFANHISAGVTEIISNPETKGTIIDPSTVFAELSSYDDSEALAPYVAGIMSTIEEHNRPLFLKAELNKIADIDDDKLNSIFTSVFEGTIVGYTAEKVEVKNNGPVPVAINGSDETGKTQTVSKAITIKDILDGSPDYYFDMGLSTDKRFDAYDNAQTAGDIDKPKNFNGVYRPQVEIIMDKMGIDTSNLTDSEIQTVKNNVAMLYENFLRNNKNVKDGAYAISICNDLFLSTTQMSDGEKREVLASMYNIGAISEETYTAQIARIKNDEGRSQEYKDAKAIVTKAFNEILSEIPMGSDVSRSITNEFIKADKIDYLTNEYMEGRLNENNIGDAINDMFRPIISQNFVLEMEQHTEDMIDSASGFGGLDDSTKKIFTEDEYRLVHDYYDGKLRFVTNNPNCIMDAKIALGANTKSEDVKQVIFDTEYPNAGMTYEEALDIADATEEEKSDMDGKEIEEYEIALRRVGAVNTILLIAGIEKTNFDTWNVLYGNGLDPTSNDKTAYKRISMRGTQKTSKAVFEASTDHLGNIVYVEELNAFVYQTPSQLNTQRYSICPMTTDDGNIVISDYRKSLYSGNNRPQVKLEPAFEQHIVRNSVIFDIDTIFKNYEDSFNITMDEYRQSVRNDTVSITDTRPQRANEYDIITNSNEFKDLPKILAPKRKSVNGG